MHSVYANALQMSIVIVDISILCKKIAWKKAFKCIQFIRRACLLSRRLFLSCFVEAQI